jgi:hypothetical protein
MEVGILGVVRSHIGEKVRDKVGLKLRYECDKIRRVYDQYGGKSMRTIKHRFMTVLLCCLLAISTLLATVAAFPVTAEAAEIHPYSFSSTNAYMTGVCKEGETPSSDVVIPETFTYKGVKYTVTEIGMNAFSENTKVTSVTIPSTVRSIDYHAFGGCTNLKSVTISKNAELNSIGELAFSGCTSLKEIYINAETVEEYAFWNCTKLSKVTFGNKVKEIRDYAFQNTALKSITFGKNITTIGDSALSGCSKLEKIVIGENVTALGGDIASGKHITSITVKSEKLKFENCGNADIAPFGNLSAKVKTKVPDGKEEEYGFLWTDNWEDEEGYVRFAISSSNAYMTGICKKGKTPSGAVKIPATFTYDDVNYKVVKIDGFSNNKKITSVEIPSTVAEIGANAFRDCSKLKTVTISKKVKLRSIDNYAFYGCTSLKEIYINAETVGDLAFIDCSSLEKVTFGDNVKEIGYDAFTRTAIKSINFGKNITTIGGSAVSSCPDLESITIGENVTAIGSGIDAFCENVKTITVKSTKLKAENCGAYGQSSGTVYLEPFVNFSEKETIKVPKAKLSSYKNILGQGSWGTSIIYKTF